jgi:hypothetical protein
MCFVIALLSFLSLLVMELIGCRTDWLNIVGAELDVKCGELVNEVMLEEVAKRL